jgi:nicotinamide mononucleotide transporter
MSLSEITGNIIAAVRQTDSITWVATAAAIFYVILALKESIWCWIFGILSSGLSVGVYFSQELYFESALNVFYVLLGIYGWMMWSRREEKKEVPVTSISPQLLKAVCLIGLVAFCTLAYLSDRMTDAEYSEMDAGITVASIIATWMTAKKFLENWILWIIIDVCSAMLYIVKGPQMYLFALLFIFYTFMAVAGYFAWKKNLRT